MAAALAMLFAAATPATAASPKQFLANLNAGQETPPTNSTGLGVAHLTFDGDTDMLCFSITYTGLSSAEIVAHIHGPGLPGVAAGILFPIGLGNPKQGCVGPLDFSERADLLKSLLYINIHTVNFPGGEIRGQILRIR